MLMWYLATAKLSGLLAVVVGISGYSIDSENAVGDISAVKVITVLFFFLAIEFILHQLFIDNIEMHHIIHIVMALTVFLAGIYGLHILKRQPITFNVNRFKEIIVYGTIIWLVDKNLNLAEYPSVYFVLIALSLSVAILSLYVIIKITKLRAFFIVERDVPMCAYFIITLIGISAIDYPCILSLLVSAMVEFYLFYIILKIAEPLLR